MEVITCLEIDDNYVSLIIGYLTEDNKVALLYKNVKRFDVEDIFSLKPTIVAQTIVDLISNAKYSNIQFNNFYALLSPKKCNSYSSTVLTYVSNSDSIVSETDINNLMSMAKKKNIRDDQKIVEIIPVSFKLSNGNELKVKPIGEKSNEISMSYKFHCVDINTYNYYSEIFKICNLNQVQFLISSINLPNIFRNIKNFPSNYFLVFSKENITNITLLGKGEPIKTNTIKFGFIDLYKKIANHFNISIQNAKKLVKIFGFDKFREIDLKDYTKFKMVLKNFKDWFQLNEFTAKEIDQYLWQVGNNLFRIDKIIDEYYSETKDIQKTENMIRQEYGFSIQEDYIRQIVEIK